MAQEPFSTQVATPQWRALAQEWLTAALTAHGIAVTGEIEQPRIRPWSTQLVVPTDAGRIWFKATCPAMAFEPPLQQTMARLVPGAVQAPLAADGERGWMLTLDHGPTVGDQRTPTAQDWRRALAEAARVQRALVGHREELLATGLPDAGPETIVVRFDRLLEIHEQSPADHGRVPPARIEELRARRSELVDACAVLAASSIPSTWQHGDLHPWNLHGSGDHVAFFDLGDGMWAHAVELLSVPYGVVTSQDTVAWEEVVPAWCEVWEIEQPEFDLLWRASGFTHAVNRAVTWHRALLTATTEELVEWGSAVEDHLTSMLDA